MRDKPSRFGQSQLIHTNNARSLPRSRRRCRVTPQSNIELMPEKEVLDFKPAPRLEQVGAKIPKQLKECEHCAG
jgi:hypothetical protein